MSNTLIEHEAFVVQDDEWFVMPEPAQPPTFTASQLAQIRALPAPPVFQRPNR